VNEPPYSMDRPNAGSRAPTVRDQRPYGFVMRTQNLLGTPDAEGTWDRCSWYPRPTWPVGPGICEVNTCDYLVVTGRRKCGWCLYYGATGHRARDADVEMALDLMLL
jgi:hypothetical protein